MSANLENSAVATGLEKVSFHSNPKERQCQRMFKLPHNCTYLTCWQSNAQNSLSQASTVCELWTSRCWSWKNQISNCQHPLDHWKSKRVPEKHLFLLYWLCQCLWLCGSQQTVENSSRDGNTRLPDLHTDSWEICMQVKKQQLELDMEHQTVSKLGKEYIKTVYGHPASLTYMKSASWETLDWKKHKLESRLPGEISITSDM